MNFEESNQFVEQMEKNNRNKKSILMVLMICAILVLILIVAIIYMKQKDAQQLKMFVDDKQVSMSSTILLQTKEGEYYVNAKELANLLGYSYQKGEYKNYTEDAQSCYLRTPYEIMSMNANSNTITKYILNTEDSTTEDKPQSKDLILIDEKTKEQKLNIVVDSKNETEEIFTIQEPIQYVNDELYISFSELPKVFSVQLSTSVYNGQLNRIKINSIPKIATTLPQIATQLGYTQVSNLYENLMAISDHMLVVGDGSKYGVVSLKDGKEIISLKYDKIVYHQNTDEFFVTAENSVGIVDKSGNTIVKPTEYDSIANLDEVNKLYLVQKDEKYGVINRQGDTVVYAEYDSIGIENTSEFSKENIRNFQLLFDECLPVNRDGKVGIIDIEGNERLKCVYDALGYTRNNTTTKPQGEQNENDEEETTTNTTTQNATQTNETSTTSDYDNLLTIPESLGIKGIVVNLNGLYGIYDVVAKRLIVPCVYTKIYSKTRSGVTNYYLEFEEQEIDLRNFLQENNLISIKSSENEENNNMENENQE